MVCASSAGSFTPASAGGGRVAVLTERTRAGPPAALEGEDCPAVGSGGTGEPPVPGVGTVLPPPPAAAAGAAAPCCAASVCASLAGCPSASSLAGVIAWSTTSHTSTSTTSSVALSEPARQRRHE